MTRKIWSFIIFSFFILILGVLFINRNYFNTNRTNTNHTLPLATAENYAKLKEKTLEISTEEISKIKGVDGKIDTYSELNNFGEYMKTEGTTYVNAEDITLWFNNFPSNKYSQEERKKISYDIISKLRVQIVSGEISMSQAGEIIKNNKSLKDVDSAWESNAYRVISFAKKNVPSYVDKNLEETLWSLKTGEVSNVIEGAEYVDGKRIPSFYTIIKLTMRKDQKYESLEEFIK